MIGKILALAGIGVATYTAVDRMNTGSWWWQKVTTANARQAQLQQAMFNARVQQQVQSQLKAKEAERLRKETASTTGKYATQSYWAQQPKPVNFSLNHW